MGKTLAEIASIIKKFIWERPGSRRTFECLRAAEPKEGNRGGFGTAVGRCRAQCQLLAQEVA